MHDENNYYNTVYIYWLWLYFFYQLFRVHSGDSRGVFGWEAVDALAGYLVCLNRTITALSSQEEADIVQLYMALACMDKVPSKYSQKVKKRLCQWPLESIQEAEWLCLQDSRQQRVIWTIGASLVFNLVYSPDYIILLSIDCSWTHGQAAHDPEVHRVCECVCIRLFERVFSKQGTGPRTHKENSTNSTIYCGGIQPLENSCWRTAELF